MSSTVEEMKILAKTLRKCKSYKERQKRLSESIDWLSFEYPDLYSLLSREMKRRETESNNPNKISRWLNSSNSYIKLHEALILVKNNNIIAKEEYLDSLKRMLFQTIENGSYINESLKICHLIEKSAHLKSIRDHLKYLIQRVYQLKDNKRYSLKNLQSNKAWQNNFNQLQYSFKRLNIENDQPRNSSMFQSISSKLPDGLSGSELDCNGYNSEILTSANRHPSTEIAKTTTFLNLTIIDQNMNGVIAKWLYYLKLHKYQWFFNGLSYNEIESLNEDNIEGFIVKVNKNTITKGAQNKICISTKTLRDRKHKLKDLLMSLDLEVTLNELCEISTYMRDILHYPIPNKSCTVSNQLQQDIVCVLEKLHNQLLEKLGMTRSLSPESLFGNSINKFLECTILINKNQAFVKQQVSKILILAETLKYKVHQMPRNLF